MAEIIYNPGKKLQPCIIKYPLKLSGTPILKTQTNGFRLITPVTVQTHIFRSCPKKRRVLKAQTGTFTLYTNTCRVINKNQSHCTRCAKITIF